METEPLLLRNNAFLSEGGCMGGRIRGFDWTGHALGPPERWPLPLRTAVRVMLTTNHPVFIFWGGQHICLYNDAYSRSIGPEKHPGILGMPGHQAWPEIWHIIGPQIEYVMAGRGATWHENHLVPIDRHGRREDVYWTYSYSPVDDPDAASGVGGVLVLCTETTKQVQDADRMRRAEERWRRLFDQAPGFMAVLGGPSHVIEFANPAFFRLIDHRDVVGKPVAESLPWAVEQGFTALLDQVYRRGRPHVAQSVPMRMPHPESEGVVVRYVDYVYQPIRNEEGEVTGILVQGSDVSERERAMQGLREADRRKDEFLATLAHELRNPLAPIQTGIELLRLDGNSPAAVAASLAMMERQISHLVRLVDDLLDLARISRGKITLRFERTPVEDAVRKAVETCRASLHPQERRLALEVPGRPLFVQADPVRLVQVVGNLLNNAVKFTSDGGRIQVSVRQEGDHVVIGVRDDGVGIPPDMLCDLFGLFVQVAPAKGGGLGIGLALVESLVRLHGGTVEARSAGEGRGSEFLVRLPLLAEEPPRMAGTRGATPRLEGLRVLIVDDNEDAGGSLRLLLAALGADVRYVASGGEALDVLAHFAPALILLDIGMPVMDGYEVARRLADWPGRPGAIVAAVTGWGQEGDRRRTREAGFDAHLVKPVSLADLDELAALLRSDG